MTSITFTIPTRPSLGHRLRVWAAQALAAHQRRRDVARMRAELAGLSDLDLRDLGLHRCEIDAVVAEAQMPVEQRRRRVRAL